MKGDDDLILQFLELHPGRLASGSSLQPGEDGADLVLSLLLHPATDAGPEEDLGVAKPVLVLVQLDKLKHCPSGTLVILCFCHLLRSQDVVSRLEFLIDHLVWESSATYSDPGKDTVALVLMHHQRGFHTSRLLVGVRHHAADEVRLGLVVDIS